MSVELRVRNLIIDIGIGILLRSWEACLQI